MHGRARVTPQGTVVVNYEWGAPLTGRGRDEFSVAGDTMVVAHTNWVGDREVCYRQVYHRKA
jgi:hypothetical protein